MALLAAILVSIVLWPRAWLAGESIYSTDAVLAHEPWASEADVPGEHPYNPELGDHDLLFFPQLVHVQRTLHGEGVLALWNTGIYGGVPNDGNPQLALFYPFHLALLLFQDMSEEFSVWRVSLGLTWMGILRFVLCATFAYLWLRRAGGRPWVAAGAALFVSAGPYAALWRLHTPEQVFSLVPVTLYFVEGLPSRRSVAGLGLAMGVAHLGGYPQTSLLFGVFVLLYAWLRSPRDARRAVLRATGFGLGLSVLIALPSWLPFVTYLEQSVVRVARLEQPLLPAGVAWWQVVAGGAAGIVALVVSWRLAAKGTVAGAVLAGLAAAGGAVVAWLGGGDGQAAHLLLAGVTGHPVRDEPFSGPLGRPFLEVHQDHVGVVLSVLLTAGSGAFVRVGRVLLVVVLVLASAFPLVHQGVRLALPLLEPTRFACLVPLLVALLAVYAAESLLVLGPDARARRVRVAGAGVLAFLVAVLAWVAWTQERTVVGVGAIVSLVVAGAVLLLARRQGAVAASVVTGAVLAVAPGYAFQPALAEGEVYPETETVGFLRAEAERDPDLRVFAPGAGGFPGNSLLAHGLRQALGADNMDPWHYLSLVMLLNYPDEVPPDRSSWRASDLRLDRPLFDLLAARVVVARKGAWLPEHFRVLRETPAIVVAENPRAAPRVWLTGRSYVMQEDAGQILARPPNEHVGLDAGEKPELPGAPLTSGSARIVARGPHRLEVLTQADGAGWLVVADGHLRGWQGTVDREPAEIFSAFGAYRCVIVPAGEHRVRFEYRPWEVRWGLWGAMLGLVVVMLMVTLPSSRVGKVRNA